MLRRRSQSRVTPDAPDTAEIVRLTEVAATMADYGSLRPWRLIELRGDARARLGAAFVEASSAEGKHAEKLAGKPLRASLLIAVVASRQENFKVHAWEQDIAAAGVGHALNLLLHEAGWGAMWRSGPLTRTDPVRRMHGLADNEELLGWLYVGGLTEKPSPDRKPAPVESLVTTLR
ncbi:nitroreductase family protein [Diaminobutyricimonas aerilata]|nr:nitroreductase family protein [Diaminobutyricimonas aerilata]